MGDLYPVLWNGMVSWDIKERRTVYMTGMGMISYDRPLPVDLEIILNQSNLHSLSSGEFLSRPTGTELILVLHIQNIKIRFLAYYYNVLRI